MKRDYRTGPRKPAAERKSKTITPKLTPGEYAAIRAAAKAEKMTIRDYVVSRCIGNTAGQ